VTVVVQGAALGGDGDGRWKLRWHFVGRSCRVSRRPPGALVAVRLDRHTTMNQLGTAQLASAITPACSEMLFQHL